ncbi:hypothetical protein PoB_000929800 [Plakobranchus ocellatus]|uniref:Uncharacterized protein n=1 Tax=Plakobranchus ocellatus TaxID=259542 RepID=A0AAV3YKP4_9GAST|nr:hypothetical protein PoB_000929800 [Plakobranchus ocellatus]
MKNFFKSNCTKSHKGSSGRATCGLHKTYTSPFLAFHLLSFTSASCVGPTGIDLSSILRGKNDQPIGQQKPALPLSLKRKEWQKRCIDKQQPFTGTVITFASWIHLFSNTGRTSGQTKAPAL